jgi:hypothetical protein
MLEFKNVAWWLYYQVASCYQMYREKYMEQNAELVNMH